MMQGLTNELKNFARRQRIDPRKDWPEALLGLVGRFISFRELAHTCADVARWVFAGWQ